MKPMRILAAYAGPFPAPFGTQVLVAGALEQLAARGHDLHLAVYPVALAGRLPSNITIHRAGPGDLGLQSMTGPAWQRPVLDGFLARQLRQLVQELEPDILYPHHYEALAATWLARMPRRIPILFHCHALWSGELATYESMPSGWGGLLGRAADRLLPRQADRVISLSDIMARELETSGVPRERIDVVRPGVELDVVLPDREACRKKLGLEGLAVVAYLGNLEKYQGVEVLLEAMSRLGDSVPGLALVIATHEPEGKRTAAILERSRSRTVLVSGEPWSEALAAADVVAAPRLVPGGVPIKILNALAARKPMITTPEGAFDLPHGEACRVVPSHDPQALAQEIRTLLESPELAARIARQGRAWVETHHAWGSVTSALEASLEKTLESRAP